MKHAIKSSVEGKKIHFMFMQMTHFRNHIYLHLRLDLFNSDFQKYSHYSVIRLNSIRILRNMVNNIFTYALQYSKIVFMPHRHIYVFIIRSSNAGIFSTYFWLLDVASMMDCLKIASSSVPSIALYPYHSI